MRKMSFAALIAGSFLLLSSCSNQNTETTAATTTSDTNQSPTETIIDTTLDTEIEIEIETEIETETTDQEQPETSSEDDFEQIVTKLCKGYFEEDSAGKEIPNPDYLPLPEFSELPESAVFDVLWDTTDGTYTAGTSFLMDTEYSEEPLLITAIHYFGDSKNITGEELPNYVNGGELYDILKDRSKPDGSINSVLTIPDAVGIGPANSAAKDVAAFTVSDASSMYAFPIASEPCQPGDMIYLAAYLSDENTYYYNDCLYPCVVISDDGTKIYYLLSDKFITSGASGGPLLNSKGEVVGIHIASANSVRCGHSVQSICEQLKTTFGVQ